MTPTPRTRFAPSPTGFMHVGGVRTALFSWLVARAGNGQFILRIEDTDKIREVEGSAAHIMESLTWLGIDWDEGIGVGGSHAPYLQSERLARYKEWAQKLIDSGHAYVDHDYSPEGTRFRSRVQRSDPPVLYRDNRPDPALDTADWYGNKAIRFKCDPKAYEWDDAVLGRLSTGPEVVDDFIIMKRDGYPTYNFAHIVDDYEMGVTHVLRSQEFLASVPKYLNLYEALGIDRPVLATLPYVMAIDGKKKLSKRDGAKDILDYKNEGYLPEALMNFLATLGWNDGTEQEIFSESELIGKFTLARVQKSPARFDEARLLWLNGQWIRRLSMEELYERAEVFWGPGGQLGDVTYKHLVLRLVADRLKTLADLPLLSEYFFNDPMPQWDMVDTNKQLKKLERAEHVALLKQAVDALEKAEFHAEPLTDVLNALLETTTQKPAVLFSLIRYALTWAPFSPGLAETMGILGKERTLLRLHAAINAA